MIFFKNCAKFFKLEVIFFQEMAIDETTTGIEEVPTASNALPRSFLNELSQQEVQQMFVCASFLSIFFVGPKNDGRCKCE